MSAPVPSAWRCRRVDAAGTTLAVYEAGSDAGDAPVVLLLHGLGHWTDAAWGRLVPLLDPALRYVAFDLPGFGASGKPDRRYDRAFFRGAVDDALTALGVERIALVGHSLGGFVAADWAGAHPHRVRSLALIAPAAFTRSPRHVALALLANGITRALFTVAPPRGVVARVLRLAVANPASIDAEHLARAYAHTQDRAVRRAFRNVYAGALPSFARRRALHADLARYRGPVFCAWGKHDRYVPIAGLRGVLRIYPHAQTLVLKNSGHLPIIEQPHDLAAALRPFLSS